MSRLLTETNIRGLMPSRQVQHNFDGKRPKALNQSISQNSQLYPIYQAFFPVQFTPLGHCSLQLFLIWYILGKLTPQICMSFSRPQVTPSVIVWMAQRVGRSFSIRSDIRYCLWVAEGVWPGVQSSVQAGCSAHYWPATLCFLFAFNSHLIILWAPHYLYFTNEKNWGLKVIQLVQGHKARTWWVQA